MTAAARRSFADAVIAAYRGWHALVERHSGWEDAKFVLINDLSRSAVPPTSFADEKEVGVALRKLLDRAPDQVSAERLQQSLFYLEQRPGRRVTKDDVERRGIPWRQFDDSVLDGLRDEFNNCRRDLVDSGQLTRSESLSRYERRTGEPGVAENIRALGETHLRRLYDAFPNLSRANFEAREVSSGRPWTNMVTFEDDRIRLVANRGELSDLGEWRRGFLALHEVAGHVLHFTQLLADETLRAQTPDRLCLAIHTYDAYFIEGVAQFITSVYLDRIAPGPTLLRMDVKRSEVWFAVRHKNLSELIDGRIDPARAAAREAEYVGGEESKLRAVYEKILEDAFFCCQTLVYLPSHRALLPALDFDDARLAEFLGALLTGYHTPGDLDRLVVTAP